MCAHGLSLLLASIMAAGDVPTLDAHDPWLAHRALVDLEQDGAPAARSLLARFRVTVRAEPDPDVGLRVRGLTRATWEAVSTGTLIAHEDGTRAWFDLPIHERERLAQLVGRLPAGERHCIYRVGAAWAAASTVWKYPASPELSASRSLVSLA